MSSGDTTTECVPTVLKTARMLDLLAIARRADPGVPLLIRGEPGAGKDTLARLIHAASARGLCAFMKVNCAFRPVDRLEADLFGHEKGGSSLANRRRLGSFEFANHGTIYLDELGALPRALVFRLFHVLRTGEVSRMGGNEVFRVDARAMASTVQSADTGGDEGLWQELHHRDVVEIRIPPLRERRDEIPVFASHFLERFNRHYRRNAELCPEALAAFQAHSWPGNVRELEEAVRRLVVGGSDVSRSHEQIQSLLLGSGGDGASDQRPGPSRHLWA